MCVCACVRGAYKKAQPAVMNWIAGNTSLFNCRLLSTPACPDLCLSCYHFSFSSLVIFPSDHLSFLLLLSLSPSLSSLLFSSLLSLLLLGGLSDDGRLPGAPPECDYGERREGPQRSRSPRAEERPCRPGACLWVYGVRVCWGGGVLGCG